MLELKGDLIREVLKRGSSVEPLTLKIEDTNLSIKNTL